MNLHEFPEAPLQFCDVDGAIVPYALYGENVEGQRPFCAYGGISTTPHQSWGGLPGALGRRFIAIGIPEGHNNPTFPFIERYAAIMGKAALNITTELYGGPVEADVAGWSWGGLVAQAIALQSGRHSSSVVDVNKLVIMASYPAGVTMIPEIPGPRNLRAMLAIMSADRKSVDPAVVYGGPFKDNEELCEQFEHLIGRDIDGASHARQLVAAMCSSTLILPTLMSRGMGKGPETLVLLGEDDPVIMMRLAQRLARSALMKTIVMEDEGHLFPVTDRRTADKINEFLDRVPKRTGLALAS